MKVKSESEVAQSCPTPSDPMDCRPPGPSVHGIFQARVLEWGAMIHMIIEMDICMNSCWAYHRYICIQIETFIDVCIYTLGFPCGSAGKESACNAGDLGLIPVLKKSPREGKGYPLQYSGLENSMD